MDKGLLDTPRPGEIEEPTPPPPPPPGGTPTTGTPPPAPIPLATEHPGGGGFQMIWLLPLVALLIGGWLAYKTLSERGPMITITFKSADGITAGKTRIKHKDVEIGKVESLRLSDDFSHVIVEARLVKGTETFLTGNTKFWAVRPRLSLKGVSGLGALMAGVHIEMEPGKGAPKNKFKALELPPVVRTDAPGAKFALQADTLGSLDAGSPVHYRDIQAGEVLGYELTRDKKGVIVHIFVKAPYHWLVRENTRFWKSSGIDLSFGAEGFKMKTGSLQSLLVGGITFDTRETLEEGKPAVSGSSFRLFDDETAIAEQAYSQKVSFVLYFKGSVRGLSIGAPVEFRGIKVGKVTDIRMEYDQRNTTFRIPVLVQIEPERVIEISDVSSDADNSPYTLLDRLVERGLRARLQTGSYLTGQLFVELDMHPGAPKTLVGENQTFRELPTLPTPFDEITASVTQFLKKLQSIPIDKIADELHATLKGTNRTVNAPEVIESIQALKSSLTVLTRLLGHVDKRVGPLSTRFEGAAVAAEKALKQAQKTMASMDGVINPEAPLHYRMLEMTRELAETARSIRIFIQMIENNPESLLFGRDR